jgi:dihydroorotase
MYINTHGSLMFCSAYTLCFNSAKYIKYISNIYSEYSVLRRQHLFCSFFMPACLLVNVNNDTVLFVMAYSQFIQHIMRIRN